MLKSSDVHCDRKIKFCTSEGPVVYWIQVLWDQNLIFATIGNKIIFTRWAIQAHVSLYRALEFPSPVTRGKWILMTGKYIFKG